MALSLQVEAKDPQIPQSPPAGCCGKTTSANVGPENTKTIKKNEEKQAIQNTGFNQCCIYGGAFEGNPPLPPDSPSPADCSPPACTFATPWPAAHLPVTAQGEVAAEEEEGVHMVRWGNS